ncbi:MAG: PQQ-dependent sugar dehydrogenase, partial [Gammaproteobacteria bacterium]|nr:PQQ-dependent sugar dehydrogenase [Gammaproteobacteria bacterium]
MNGFRNSTGRWLAALAALALVAGGVVLGVALPRGNPVDRVLHRLAGMRRDLAALEVVAERNVPAEIIETGLVPLELHRLPVGRFAGGGGAIAVVGRDILLATPKGKLAVIEPAGDARYALRLLPATVPMNLAGLEASAFATDPQFNSAYYRTLDLLPVRAADGSLRLYVSHHRFADNCIQMVVSRAPVAEGPGLTVDGSRWEDVFVASPCIAMKGAGHPFAGHQSGGRLVLRPDGHLLVSIGDFEFDGENAPGKTSMDLATHLGKILEIDPGSRAVSTYASGFRNPQGLLLAADGHLWETEHGPHGGDELNDVQQGGNYGWPEVSYGVQYGFPSRPWPSNPVQGRHEGYAKPAFAFLPSIGISNLVEADAAEFPEWAGDLLVTSLKDSSLWRLRLEEGRVVYTERIFLKERLRDIQVLPGGKLAILTDNLDLLLIGRRRTAGPGTLAPAVTVAGLDQTGQLMQGESDLDPVEGLGPEFGRKLFRSRCAGCHGEGGQAGTAPTLAGVVGRRVGSLPGFAYSAELAGAGGTWTRERLLAFLSEPRTSF